MEALGLGAIILIILAILPYVAIIGTWNETTKSRKYLEDISEQLEEAKEIIVAQGKLINMRTQEIQALQRQSGMAEIPPVMRE